MQGDCSLPQPRSNPRPTTRGSLLLLIATRILDTRSPLVCRIFSSRPPPPLLPMYPRCPLTDVSRRGTRPTPLPPSSTRAWRKITFSGGEWGITGNGDDDHFLDEADGSGRSLAGGHARGYTLVRRPARRRARDDVERTWTSRVFTTDAVPLGVAARNDGAAWRLLVHACALPLRVTRRGRVTRRPLLLDALENRLALGWYGSGMISLFLFLSRCRRVSCHATLSDAIRSLRASWQGCPPRSPRTNPGNSRAETRQRC